MIIFEPLQNCRLFGHEETLEIIQLNFSILLKREGKTCTLRDLFQVTG